MRILRILLAAAAVTVLAACSGTSSDEPTDEGSETSAASDAALDMTGDWTLASGSGADGEIPLVDGVPITMVVAEDGSVSGNASCNQYTGAATIEGSDVTFGPIASTLMACEDDRMAAEAAYLAALGGVTTGERDGDTLTLSGNGAELVFDPTE